MRKILVVALTLLGLSFLGVKPAIAEAPQSSKLEFIEVVAEIKKPVSIKEMITAHAIQYGVDPKLALAIAKCESGFNPKVVGDFGESFGLWQIHLHVHPEITKEQALDAHEATHWAMPRLKKTPEIWSCLKLI